MLINTNVIISTNAFAGFQNYTNAQFSASYAGGSLGSGAFAGPIRATTTLNNSNAVSIITIQFAGLDSFTRLLPGVIAINYPNATIANYQIESLSYYSGGNLVVDSYIVNQTSGSVSIPAITFLCQAYLYEAPF